MADALTVMSAYKLNSFHSLSVTLRSPAELGAFKDRVEHDSKAILVARGEPEYLQTASEPVNRVLRLGGYSIGSIRLWARYSARSTRCTPPSRRGASRWRHCAPWDSLPWQLPGECSSSAVLALIGAAMEPRLRSLCSMVQPSARWAARFGTLNWLFAGHQFHTGGRFRSACLRSRLGGGLLPAIRAAGQHADACTRLESGRAADRARS